MKCRLVLAACALLWATSGSAEQRLILEITGVDNALLANVRAYLSIARLVQEPGLIPLPGFEKPKAVTEVEVRSLHRRARKEILQALQPFGYYEPTVQTTLKLVADTWEAKYHIDPGPATLIAVLDMHIEGEGRDEAAIRTALRTSTLRTGERLEHSQYEQTKKILLNTALAAGYLDARYTRAELRVLAGKQRAQIELLLDTGPRYRFGPVMIEQGILDPAFVQRFVKIQPGEPFDTDRLLKLQIALSDSGYFSRTEVVVQRDAAHGAEIPVLIKTEPNRPRRYALGLGFGTDTGPRISLAAEHRRINRRGHSLSADARISGILQSIGMAYKIPIGNLVSDRLVFNGGAESEDFTDGGSANRYTLGLSQNVEWKGLQRQLYINFQHEDFSLGEDKQKVNFVIPGINLSQLRADDVLFPRKGYSWNADLRGGMDSLLSDTSFARTELSGRLVHPLGTRGRLILRTRLGATAVDDFNLLPSSERFFAGGDQSVRGYGYQKLGPTDDSGDVVGGRYLSVGSIEGEYLFIGKFGAALFIDTGNADDQFPPDLKTGAGIGFRWRSPVGMLRVDLAHPFDDSDDNYRIHVSIGPDL